MSPERWQQVREVFEEGLARPPAERRAFVERLSARDPELAREAGSLLAADGAEEAGLTWIERPLAAPARQLMEGEQPLPEGGRLGPYRLLRPLGSGGMSTVFLAARDGDGFEPQVALKLIRRDLGAGALRRFRLERRILAGLDHPYIARLLDAGTTAEGWPYLAMEPIEGLAIDRYAARHGLTVRQRLELVRKVCEAVHYAHQNLVVHRDLKPSNILVTAEGIPKLLDFGIAKLLNPGLVAPGQELTGASLVPMTPGYASPEQVRGEPITTTSDVYSLGVLLFELLTGHKPYDVAGRSPGEIERLICEAPPPAPSRVVRKELAAGAPADAPRLVAGDLDAIVLRALGKEPRRRYDSVAQLGEDLDRFLSERPVLARGDAVGYRLAKLARRNKPAAALLGIVLVFALAVTLQAGRLSRALDEVRQERERAVREGARAREVTELLVDLFETAGPDRARGEAVTAREILDRGAAKIPRLDGDPRARAALLDALGRVYQSLGLYDRAGEFLAESLALREAEEAREETVESLRHLAHLRLLRGHPDAAGSLSREALGRARRIFGEPHPEVAANLHGLAEARHALGRSEVAESLYREALAMRLALFGDEHPDTATTLGDLGRLYFDQGDLEAAEEIFRQVVALREGFGGEDPMLGTALSDLALVYRKRGDPRTAAPLFRRALEVYRATVGPEHPWVATALTNLARTKRDVGDLAAAEALLRQALALRRKVLAPGHRSLAYALYELGRALNERGAAEPAEPFLRQGLEIMRSSAGPDAAWTAALGAELGASLVALGRFEAAESLLLESYPRLEAAGGPGFGNRARSARRALAELYRRSDRPREARAYAEPSESRPGAGTSISR